MFKKLKFHVYGMKLKRDYQCIPTIHILIFWIIYVNSLHQKLHTTHKSSRHRLYTSNTHQLQQNWYHRIHPMECQMKVHNIHNHCILLSLSSLFTAANKDISHSIHLYTILCIVFRIPYSYKSFKLHEQKKGIEFLVQVDFFSSVWHDLHTHTRHNLLCSSGLFRMEHINHALITRMLTNSLLVDEPRARFISSDYTHKRT